MELQTQKRSGKCLRHARTKHVIKQLTRVGLCSREHLLQVVNALPHNLDILQAILGSLCSSECKDSCTAFQPTHMYLQRTLHCQYVMQVTGRDAQRKVFSCLGCCSRLKCKTTLTTFWSLMCLVMLEQENFMPFSWNCRRGTLSFLVKHTDAQLTCVPYVTDLQVLKQQHVTGVPFRHHACAIGRLTCVLVWSSSMMSLFCWMPVLSLNSASVR